MEISHGTRDGSPVVLVGVPSGGPPVIFDPAGWAALETFGVTSVVAQAGSKGEYVVARAGKRQTVAARLVWGADPPSQITYANGNRRDLRRANLVPKGSGQTGRVRPQDRRRPSPSRPPVATEATAWAELSPEARAAAIRFMLRQNLRLAWHSVRASEVRDGSYPLAHLLFPSRCPDGRP